MLAHGLIKERAVPPKDIDFSLDRMNHFLINPEDHTYQEG
jgi:hypothetical protein